MSGKGTGFRMFQRKYQNMNIHLNLREPICSELVQEDSVERLQTQIFKFFISKKIKGLRCKDYCELSNFKLYRNKRK